MTADASAFQGAIAEASQFSEVFAELAQGHLDSPDFLSKLVRFESDRFSAMGAGECRILVYPSDLLLRFLAAIRASNVDRGIV
jgi:hypothetical protein